MKTLLIGLVVGAGSMYAIQTFVLGDEANSRPRSRAESADRETPDVGQPANDESEALREKIVALKAALKARDEAPSDDPLAVAFAVPVPTAEEDIDALLEEWTATDDLDKLLALIRALLLQGEKGYPKLTKVLMRLTSKIAFRKYKEEQLMAKLVPAAKIAMRHQKELVGYISYLLTADKVSPMLRTGALGGAMFLSMNGVAGSEKLSPMLLQALLKGGRNVRGDQGRMLIMAMGMLKQKEAVEPLLAMLRDPANKSQNFRIVSALGEIGDRRAVGPLIQRLQDGNPNHGWRPEIRALAKIGTAEATAAAERYISGLENDDHFFNQAGNYLRERASDKVVALVRDRFRKNPGSSNMWQVMRGLADSGTNESVALLEEIAKTAENNWTKSQAQRYLDQRKKFEEAGSGAER